MKLFKALPVAAAVSAAVLSFGASAVEFHGYARAGLSTTGDGGEQLCYGSGANGHFVGRLGDECDTYVEMDLAQELYNRDGKVFRIEGMWATDIQNQGNDYQALLTDNDTDADGNNSGVRPSGEPWSGGEYAFRQFFASAKGVIGAAPEATIWAGKRFYQRKDVHWLDLFYVNNSGYGAGIEGIDAGPGKLSIAWTNFDTPGRHSYDDPDIPGNNQFGTVQNNKIDVRYAGIPLWEGASMELIGIYGHADLTEEQDDAFVGGREIDRDGYFLTAEVSHSLMGGFNKIVLQYGDGSLGHAAFVNHGGGESLNSTWWDGTLDKSYRFLDWGVVKFGKNVEMGYSFIYQKGETYGNGVSEEDPDRMSIVVRPMYKWDDVTKTTLEVGYDDLKEPWMTDSVDLYKVMVAQEWTAGRSFWARPTIRLYAGSFWGDRAEAMNANKGGDDGNFRFGAQVEAWW